jgi:putative ABC transport system permease protein
VNDLKLAFRQLLKNPGFTVVAVLTLALGIGANTAIFSLVNGVLLKPLPYPEPDRLVTLWERNPDRGIEQERVSGPNYLDWRAQNSVFSDLAASPGWAGSDTFNLVLRDTTIKVHASYTSASLFTTLGGKPLLGRTFFPEEDRKEGNRVAILSYRLWQRYFNGDSTVLGQTIMMDTYGRRDYTIVGVMPPGFGLPSKNELWLPMGWMGVKLDERRAAHWHNVIARLKPGVTLECAKVEMNTIQARLKQAHPGETIGSEVAVVPLIEQAVGRNMHTALLVLWGVVGAVLLIACANLANLMLARAATRQKEIAVRLALGAKRWRIIRQLLAESILLALLGCLLGSLLARWGLQLFVSAHPIDIPRLESVSLDGTALAFTLLVSVLTGILFGLAPAFQFSHPDLNDTLKEGSPGTSAHSSTRRTRNILVIAEVALSLVLLAGAGLMLQSFARMLSAERGFNPEHLLTAELDFSVSGFTTWVRPSATRPQVPLHELMERLRALPGVRAVGAGNTLLRRENRPPNETIAIFGRPQLKPEDQPVAEFKGLSPDWLRALGADLLRGRDFTEADTLQSPGVVLINETLARRYFPNEEPIGQYLKMGGSIPPLNATDVWGISEWNQIIGVVRDIKSLHPHPESLPEVYKSYWQWPMQSPTLLLRATGDPASLAASIRRETKAVIPNLPPPIIRTMDDLLAESIAQPRLQTRLLLAFAGLALLLAAVGLYGVLAYAVSQRQREIGIRMALGAQKQNVLSLIIRQGMKLAVIGILIGLACALALTQVLRNLLYDIKPTDPLTFAAASLLLAGVALLACWLPARKAANLNPMEALRYE